MFSGLDDWIGKELSELVSPDIAVIAQKSKSMPHGLVDLFLPLCLRFKTYR